MFDVVVIGAGVVGCAIARQLSRLQARVVVLERCDDVASGTTKANSAIVHPGHSAKPGSLMAKYNLLGNQLYDSWCKELDVPFRRNGSMTIAFTEEEVEALRKVYDDGITNGVPGMELLNGEEALKLEPNLNPEVMGALFAPSGGIVCPYELTLGMAENAFVNGVQFRFETKVESLERNGEGWDVKTSTGEIISTRAVVNAAGVYTDYFNNMVSEQKFEIIPRIGEYWMIDKTYANAFKSTIFQVPGKMGKGVLVSPTVDGTLILGPTARNVTDREDVSTTREGLDQVLEVARRSWPGLPSRSFITTFSGLRSHLARHDFVLGEVSDAPYFFNAAGIESPGLTAAPAIAVDLALEIRDRLGLAESDDYRSGRPPVYRFRHMSLEEREEAIKRDADFGRIICRCELVTEAEIRDSIRRPLGARSVDGVKRRTRAGMGRCQSGFCLPRVMDILSEELGKPLTEITKFGGESRILSK